MSKIFLIALVVFAPVALAQNVTFINDEAKAFAQPVLKTLKKQNVDLSQYREIRLKAVNGHAKVYLLSKRYHLLNTLTVDLDGTQIHAREAMVEKFKPHCPDRSIDFISFAPNNDAFELGIAEDVAVAAEKAGLKVVRLYKSAGTAAAYLDYMSCPNLRGNFYDGDANPTEIVTADGTLTGQQMQASLAHVFNYHVVNIWLACQAFNNPMRNIMLNGVESQKYAAGYNDLEVGPSDYTAACAMKAALNGEPMTAAFASCQKQFDTTADHWGFEGHGSDYFGK